MPGIIETHLRRQAKHHEQGEGNGLHEVSGGRCGGIAHAFAAQAINAPCRTGYKNDQGAEKWRSGQSRQQQEDKADQRNADADALLPTRRSPEKNPKPIIVVCTATAMISVPTAVGSST